MILMDLSKASDCTPHDMLSDKLEADSFGLDSLNSIQSSWCCIGLSSWALTAQFFIYDFIYVIKNSKVCNFADDDTIHAFDESIETI